MSLLSGKKKGEENKDRFQGLWADKWGDMPQTRGSIGEGQERKWAA